MPSHFRSASKRLKLWTAKGKKSYNLKHRNEDSDSNTSTEQDSSTVQQKCDNDPNLDSPLRYGKRFSTPTPRVSIQQRNDFSSVRENTSSTLEGRSLSQDCKVLYKQNNSKTRRNKSLPKRCNLPRAKVVTDIPKLVKDARRGGPTDIQLVQQKEDSNSLAIVPVKKHIRRIKKKEPDTIWFQNFGKMGNVPDPVDDTSSISTEESDEDSNFSFKKNTRGALNRLLKGHRRKYAEERNVNAFSSY